MSVVLRTWHVPSRMATVRLEILLGGGDPSTRDPSTRSVLLELIDEAFGCRDCETARTLLDVAAALDRPGLADLSTRMSRPTAIELLLQAFDRGRLRLDAPPRPPTESRSDDLINPFEDDPPPVQPEPEVKNWFQVRLVDDVGDPLPGIDLTFDVLGEIKRVTTDGSGIAKIEGIDGSTALVAVDDVQQVRDEVTPRWAQPREPEIAEDSDEAPIIIERLDDHFDPVRVPRKKEVTVVILPRFACREVPALTFEFARSFPRRQGIPALASIAEELHQDDSQLAWIFGHTDLSGSEKLNKRLSERRAKAVYAIFTHDFDKWEEMWRAKLNEHPWWERWGTREMQHMLNAVECPDDDGNPLDEDGDYGSKTIQAVKRFQAKDYPSVPAEQADLPVNGKANKDTRRELFFAYAKLVTRTAVDPARIAPVGNAPFMGCGEYNPLSLEAKDEESRRTVVFIFDPAAQPAAPPCVIADIGPCQAQLTEDEEQEPGDAPTEEGGEDEGPFYRCAFYRSIATCCPAAGGADLAHDVIVRFFMTLAEANELADKLVLEAEDGADEEDDDQPAFRKELALKSDARVVVLEQPSEDEDTEDDTDPDAPAGDDEDEGDGDDDSGQEQGTDDAQGEGDEEQPRLIELQFTHVPDAHAYRLRVEGGVIPHTVFDRTRFHMISELSAPLGELRFLRLFPLLNPVDPLDEPAAEEP